MQPDDLLQRRFARSPQFAMRGIAGEVMLVPARPQLGETASVWILQEVPS